MENKDQTVPEGTAEEENATSGFIENLFNDEGAFGEADCIGL